MHPAPRTRRGPGVFRLPTRNHSRAARFFAPVRVVLMSTAGRESRTQPCPFRSPQLCTGESFQVNAELFQFATAKDSFLPFATDLPGLAGLGRQGVLRNAT